VSKAAVSRISLETGQSGSLEVARCWHALDEAASSVCRIDRVSSDCIRVRYAVRISLQCAHQNLCSRALFDHFEARSSILYCDSTIRPRHTIRAHLNCSATATGSTHDTDPPRSCRDREILDSTNGSSATHHSCCNPVTVDITSFFALARQCTTAACLLMLSTKTCTEVIL